MTGSFIWDYCILVFLVAFGVIQVAAAGNKLRGLLILPSRQASMLAGAVLIAGPVAWFFLSEPRNVPDTAGGLDGNQQFAYFFAGLAGALVFTLLITSWRNRCLGTGAGITRESSREAHPGDYFNCRGLVCPVRWLLHRPGRSKQRPYAEPKGQEEPDGLGALRHSSYAGALACTLRLPIQRWKTALGRILQSRR